MCGICGVLYLREKAEKKVLQRMNNAIEHRGPDDYGYYVDGNLGLGHRRLSIIDLSRKGKQPMTNEDRTIWIIFNGEVYNYKTLKAELSKHRFNSNTDTEVVLHAYEEWGEDFINKLDGMFAFAIWDEKKKSLFLGRDRFGKKPLYYYHDNKRFVFASEIKAILEHPDVKRAVNQQALSNFLGLGYVPPPATMFEGISKLPQSHYLTLINSKVEIKRYWGMPIKDKIEGKKSIIKELFEEAVEKRLMSDVPLGAFLSGGIDSSVIVAVMSQFSKEPVKTFSVGFKHPTDELKFANLVAKRFNTDHKEIIVEYDAFKILPKVVWHLDEPLADPAVLPTYVMSKETKKHISVVLVGEGGDEVFLGYKRYRQMALLKKISKAPDGMKSMLARMANKTGKLFDHKNKKYLDFASETLPILNDDARLYGKLHHFGFDEKEKADILQKNYGIDLGWEYKMINKCFNGKETVTDKMTSFDFNVWLTDDILMKVDKTTMANALEARAPFLDTRLVQYSVNIRPEQRMGKHILKETFKELIPKQVLMRKKHGFNVPVSSWFEKGEMRDAAKEMFIYLEKEKVFKQNAMSKILSSYKKYRHDQQLWNIMTFGYWYRTFIEQKK